MPNVYMDVDLLKALAANYDPVTRTVRDFDGVDMVKVTREEIAGIFKLVEWSEDMVPIDEKVLRVEYERVRYSFNISILSKYLASIEG